MGISRKRILQGSEGLAESNKAAVETDINRATSGTIEDNQGSTLDTFRGTSSNNQGFRHSKPWRSLADKPDASEVAAKYYQMAASANYAQEDLRSFRPSLATVEPVAQETTVPAEPVIELPVAQETNVPENADQMIEKSIATVESQPSQNPMPLINEVSTLTEDDNSQLENAVWYRCENPYCKYTHFLDVHHIVDESKGGTNRLDNLIVLCPYCHELAHRNEIPEEEMREWINHREERFKAKLQWPYY